MASRDGVCGAFAFAGSLAILAALAGCASSGMPYMEAQGSDLATVRVASQEGSAAARKDPATRILQVDGKRIPDGAERSRDIRVAGPERDWAVSITNEEMGGEEVAPVKVVRTQRSCPDSP